MQQHTTSGLDISEWKGQEIILFKEDLQEKVKGTISEKSFYSYFKSSSEKLPRIDILNLLSQYCGYKNWNDFKSNHPASSRSPKNRDIQKRFGFGFVFLGFIILTVIYFLIPKENTFSFCFIDQDRNRTVKTPIDIIILNNGESPFYSKSDSVGCFIWKTKDNYIHFIIQSPYHKTDTIYRTASSKSPENLHIKTDDYALMLHYYANGKIEDWQNRRKELAKIIADNATIFQVLPHRLGIEMYTKKEFIDKLTTPTQSLKNIEVIESQKLNEQIVKLKFRIKS